jgi:NADH:ubiquinone oxidoreductase subunit 4 (subunit M)
MALAVGLGTLIEAAVLLWYYQRAFLLPVDQPVQAKLLKLGAPEIVIVVSLAVMIFGMNLFGQPIERVMSGSVHALAARMEESGRNPAHGSQTGGEPNAAPQMDASAGEP